MPINCLLRHRMPSGIESSATLAFNLIVAVGVAIWLALDWRVGVACCLTWLVAAAIWRISSLAALAAAATSTIWALLLTGSQTLLLAGVLTLLVYWRHSANIARIKSGTEPKIGQS